PTPWPGSHRDRSTGWAAPAPPTSARCGTTACSRGYRAVAMPPSTSSRHLRAVRPRSGSCCRWVPRWPAPRRPGCTPGGCAPRGSRWWLPHTVAPTPPWWCTARPCPPMTSCGSGEARSRPRCALPWTCCASRRRTPRAARRGCCSAAGCGARGSRRSGRGRFGESPPGTRCAFSAGWTRTGAARDTGPGPGSAARGPQDLVEPRPTGLEGLARLALGAGVTRRPGLGELLLEIVDRLVQLGGGPFRAGPLLRVRPAPALLVGLAHRLLHGAHPTLHALDVGPRHLAHPVPLVLDRAQGGLGGVRVGDRQQRLGLLERLELHLEVGRVLGVDLGVLRVTRVEEPLTRGPEAGPQGVVLLAAGPAGGLPPVHELAVRRGGASPVGGGGQCLRLRDELLLDPLRLGLGGVELGEPVPPVAVEGGAGAGEPLPQRVLRGAVQARSGALGLLPLLEQGTQLLTRGTPVRLGRVRGGDRLGPLDDGGALLQRLALGGLALGGDLPAPLLGPLTQHLQPPTQRVEVTDGGQLGQRLGERAEGLLDLLG